MVRETVRMWLFHYRQQIKKRENKNLHFKNTYNFLKRSLPQAGSIPVAASGTPLSLLRGQAEPVLELPATRARGDLGPLTSCSARWLYAPALALSKHPADKTAGRKGFGVVCRGLAMR